MKGHIVSCELSQLTHPHQSFAPLAVSAWSNKDIDVISKEVLRILTTQMELPLRCAVIEVGQIEISGNRGLAAVVEFWVG